MLKSSAKSNPAFRYELSQTSYSRLPRSSISASSPSFPSLPSRRSDEDEGDRGERTVSHEADQTKAATSRPALPPPLAPRKRAAFRFLGKEQRVNRRVERIEGIRWRGTPCSMCYRMGRESPWSINLSEATKDSLPSADSSHCSEPQWKRSVGREMRRLA